MGGKTFLKADLLTTVLMAASLRKKDLMFISPVISDTTALCFYLYQVQKSTLSLLSTRSSQVYSLRGPNPSAVH